MTDHTPKKRNDSVLTTSELSENSAQRAQLRVWQDREDEHRETLRRLQLEIDTKNLELDDLAKHLAQKEVIVSEIESLDGLLNDLRAKVTDTKSKLTFSKEQVKDQLKLLEEHQSQLARETRRAQDVKNETEHLRSTADFLVKRLSELRTEESALNQKIQDFRIEEKKRLDIFSQHEQVIQEKQHYIQQAKLQIEALERDCQARRSNLHELDIKESQCRTRVIALEQDCDDAKRKVAAQEVRVQDLESHNQQLIQQVTDSTKRLEQVRADFATLQLELGTRTAELTHLMQSREQVLGELGSATIKRDDVKAQIADQQRQLLALEERFLLSQDRISQITLQLEDKKLQIEQYERQEERHKDNMARLEDQVRHFESKVTKLRDQNSDEEMHLKVLNDERERQEKQILRLTKEQTDLELKIESIRNLSNRLLLEKNEIAEQIKRSEEKIKEQEQHQHLATKRTETVKERLNELESLMRAQQSALQQGESERARQILEIETLNDKIQNLRSLEVSLAQSRATEEALIGTLREQVYGQERNMAELTKQIEGERVRLAQEKERVTLAHVDAERARKRHDDVAEQLDDLVGQRDRAQSELLELRKAALSKSEELSELEALRQDKLLRIEELRSELLQLRNDKIKQEQSLRRTQVSNQVSQQRRTFASLRESLKVKDPSDPHDHPDNESGAQGTEGEASVTKLKRDAG